MRTKDTLVSLRCAAAVLFVAVASAAFGQSGQAGAQLRISGDVEKPLTLSAEDLKSLPRTTLRVMNTHSGMNESYEGVRLIEVLQRAGVPLGEKLREPAMATYVLASARDGYRVLFSLPELDPAFDDSEVLIADTLDGAKLGEQEGPYKLVVPHDKRPARWIRILQSIQVVRLMAPQGEKK